MAAEKKTAIIFGVGGQDGYYLRELLLRRGISVVGVSRNAPCERPGSVADWPFVKGLVEETKPDYVFHLAACSTTRHSALFENHATISAGALNVLEAVRLHRPECRVFISGSGVQFRNAGAPISEREPFEARSPYAVFRIESVYAARYFRTLGVRAYVGYLFHHESPRRQPNHLCKMISEAAKRIARGGAERIRLGDLSVRKEAGFAGDIMEGVLTLVEQDGVFEAAIGTGTAYSVRDWLDVCFAKVGLDWRAYVDEANEGFTPEYRVLVSDPATIQGLGWRPKVGFDALADMMLN
jgi:GDPmannose 4,6-dehydratase